MSQKKSDARRALCHGAITFIGLSAGLSVGYVIVEPSARIAQIWVVVSWSFLIAALAVLGELARQFTDSRRPLPLILCGVAILLAGFVAWIQGEHLRLCLESGSPRLAWLVVALQLRVGMPTHVWVCSFFAGSMVNIVLILKGAGLGVPLQLSVPSSASIATLLLGGDALLAAVESVAPVVVQLFSPAPTPEGVAWATVLPLTGGIGLAMAMPRPNPQGVSLSRA